MQSYSAKLPADWIKVPKVATRSELLETRKKDQQPDISFDLDGDGVVGGKDYLIGKRFDYDCDGKLSPDEHLKAKAAMSELESSLIWGCDSSGNNKSFRIVQKRGNVIVNEDFADVVKSYPAFPVTAESQVRSKTELEAKRKEEIRIKGKYYEDKMKSEYWKVVKDEKLKVNVQKSCAEYRQQPKFKTRAEMMQEKKKQLLEDLTASCNFKHKSPYERLLVREMQGEISPERTQVPLQEKIRQQNMQHFLKTYSKRPAGLHGAELPKFSENLKEYWKGDKMLSAQSSSNKLTIVKKEDTGSQDKNNQKTYKIKKPENFEKPNEVEFIDSLPSKDFYRNSRWTGYHYNFIKKPNETGDRRVTKSTTPEMQSKHRNAKTPKSLISDRMSKKGSNSPSKSLFRSTGFNYTQN